MLLICAVHTYIQLRKYISLTLIFFCSFSYANLKLRVLHSKSTSRKKEEEKTDDDSGKLT